MKSSKALAIFFSILLATTTLTNIPLLKAEIPSTYQQASTSVNQQTLANYVVGVTANRVPLKLIPIPSVSVNSGVTVGPNEADIIVLAVPATQKSGNVDLVKFVTGFLTKAAARQEGLSGQLIADLYSSLYNHLIEMGAKQAFLPYENLTFTFIIIIWIKTKSFSDFISSVGASMLKSLSDSLIIITFSLTDSVIQEIETSIKNKINEIVNDIKNQINNELNNLKTKLINYLNSKIDSMQCNSICVYINQTIKKCNYTIDSISVSSSVIVTFKNGAINLSIEINEISEKYQSSDIAAKSKEIFSKNAGDAVMSQSYDRDLVDSSQVTSIIDTIGGFIYDSVYSLTFTIASSKIFTVSAEGEYSSCEAAKSVLKKAAEKEVTNIISFVRNEMNKTLTKAAEKINQNIATIFKEISTTLDTIETNLKNAANEAVNYAKDFLETAVHTAISQAITKANPMVFAVYTLAEGISQALQSCVSSISVTAKPPLSDNLDQSILIVEEKRSGTQEVIREVRLPKLDDTVTAEKSTSLGEKVLSAAKGFAAGILGAIFGPAAQKMINTIPSVFVVNVQLKSNSKWLIAPSWPGVHTISLKVSPRTYAEWLSSLPNNLKNTLFKNIQKNKLAERLNKLFDISLDKVSIQGVESGSEMILPYLVLPPYFIVERIQIENGIVSIRFAAIYDFSALLRIFISDQLNKFREIVNKATDVAAKLRETIRSAIESFVKKFVDTVISYFTSKLSVDYIKSLIEDLYESLIDYIFDKFIDPILDQLFYRYIMVHIDRLIGFINEILNRVEQQLELFSQYLALTLSVIRVDVVNCDIELVPALPSLGFVGNRPIDRFGKVEVQISQSIFYKYLGNYLGVVPLYRSVGPDGRVSHFIAPWAACSLEPVVTPLIPVARMVNNKLSTVFLSPFVNQLTNVRFTFVIDGIDVREVPADALKKAAIVGVRVISVQIEDTRGVGSILPLPIESPLLVNPSILARRV